MRLDPLQEAQLQAEGTLIAARLETMPLPAALAALRTPKPPQTTPPDETALVEDRMIPGRDNHLIPIRVYRPAANGVFSVLLHLHGGGWVGGGIGNDDLRCHAMSRRANIIVVSVGYRLAPEHKFPAGLEDAYAALAWVHDYADEIGANPDRIGISGSSAGGNLAAAVTLLARDRFGPELKCQVLAYPICDTSLSQPSYAENAQAPLLTARMMAWFIEQYLPAGVDRQDRLVAPLRAPDLAGLPPALIVTAECDPLRDEGMAYAERLRQAGVAAEAICYTGMVHGFITRSPGHAQSLAAMARFVEALARHL